VNIVGGGSEREARTG